MAQNKLLLSLFQKASKRQGRKEVITIMYHVNQLLASDYSPQCPLCPWKIYNMFRMLYIGSTNISCIQVLLSLSRSAVQEKAISRSFSVYPSLPWSDIATSPLLRCPFVSWLLDLSTSVFCICLINWLACVSLRVSGQTKIDGLSDDTARFHSEMHTQEVFWSPFETVRCKIWSTSRFHSKLVCSRNCEICYHHIPIKYT